jgi:hypothetical protein
MVFERRSDRAWQWAAIASIAAEIGCTAQFWFVRSSDWHAAATSERLTTATRNQLPSSKTQRPQRLSRNHCCYMRRHCRG